ncbi:L-rhamnose mutarotase [Pseudactinotalea sp. Z1739]|uniref:L-rhamnose mutarotase n=1 Tax=Pseudactinotalea sp. Z1739 TaxID=3413028 RepID=UPI003C7E30A3
MRVAVHTKLKAGAEQAYDEAHREVPAELVAAMRANGVHDWRIWRSGLDVFQVIECDDYAALLTALRDLPVNIAWQERMGQMQDVTHDYSADGADDGLPMVWNIKDVP